MIMVRLQVTLNEVEADSLMIWATTELRDPREQIRFILRQELERRGFLVGEQNALPTEEIEHGGSNDSG
jgi:hypothetical protein